jgi:ankyrin repeat protein
MIRLLLDHGATRSATNDDGLTPLDVARKKGRARAVRELENRP